MESASVAAAPPGAHTRAARRLTRVDPAWLLVVPAYLLGTFPTAILVGRREGRDPTQEGSGNPGASNTFRTMGRRAGAIVLLGDVAKGALAAGMGLATGQPGRRGGVRPGGRARPRRARDPAVPRRQGRGHRRRDGAGAAPGADAGARGGVVRGRAGARGRRVGRLGGGGGRPSRSAAALVGPAAPGRWSRSRPCGLLVVVRHRDNLDRLRRGEERSLAPEATE